MFFKGLKDKFKYKSGRKYLERELKLFPAPVNRKPGVRSVGVIADLEKFNREIQMLEDLARAGRSDELLERLKAITTYQPTERQK